MRESDHGVEVGALRGKGVGGLVGGRVGAGGQAGQAVGG